MAAKRRVANEGRSMSSDGSDNRDEAIQRLNDRYRGQYVVVDPQWPELVRLVGIRGQVVAVNCNGRALVRFDGVDEGWHDIDPDCLKIADRQP
jgi:hypothetical protein